MQVQDIPSVDLDDLGLSSIKTPESTWELSLLKNLFASASETKVSISGASLIQPLIVVRKMQSDKWLPSKTVSLQSRHARWVTKRVHQVFGERSPSPPPWVERKISSGTASRADKKTLGNLPKKKTKING